MESTHQSGIDQQPANSVLSNAVATALATPTTLSGEGKMVDAEAAAEQAKWTKFGEELAQRLEGALEVKRAAELGETNTRLATLTAFAEIPTEMGRVYALSAIASKFALLDGGPTSMTKTHKNYLGNFSRVQKAIKENWMAQSLIVQCLNEPGDFEQRFARIPAKAPDPETKRLNVAEIIADQKAKETAKEEAKASNQQKDSTAKNDEKKAQEESTAKALETPPAEVESLTKVLLFIASAPEHCLQKLNGALALRNTKSNQDWASECGKKMMRILDGIEDGAATAIHVNKESHPDKAPLMAEETKTGTQG